MGTDEKAAEKDPERWAKRQRVSDPGAPGPLEEDVQQLLNRWTVSRRTNGHWLVAGEDELLDAWLEQTRRELQAGVAEDALEEAARAAGVPMTAEAWTWEEQYATLQAQLAASQDRQATAFRAGEWLRLQANRRGRGLPEERWNRLVALGKDVEALLSAFRQNRRGPVPRPPPLRPRPRRKAQRGPVRDPASTTVKELVASGVPEPQVRAWIAQGRLVPTGKPGTYLRTRGLKEEIAALLEHRRGR